MIFLTDVDVKGVRPEKKIRKRHIPNWATKYNLCLTNIAIKWVSNTKTHYKRDYKNNGHLMQLLSVVIVDFQIILRIFKEIF